MRCRQPVAPLKELFKQLPLSETIEILPEKVTGGAGFLGSHLCERLLNEQHEVICLDNLFTGRKGHITNLLDNPRFEFMRHDVIDPFKLEVDRIYNLVCPASPVHYLFNPIKATKTSVMAAINCLGLAKRVKARVFQASTSEVHGDPEVHPQVESYRGSVNPFGPRAYYDEEERCAETLFFDYHRENGVDLRVVLIFNTYGPRMLPNDGRVVSNFIVQALKGNDITIYGKGDQTHSFCYVDDLIEGFVRFMEQEEIVGPMNLGNPEEFTILELAEKVITLTGSPSKVQFKPLPKDDPYPLQARYFLGPEAPEQLGTEGSTRRGLEEDDPVFRRKNW